MRNTIRTYVLAFSLIAALATSVSAAPKSKSGQEPDGFFARVKSMIVHLLDDSKIVIPPG
jgi:hypothetical protein